MDTILPFAFIAFASFFTLTNPLGTMPVFLTMTTGMDEQQRAHIVMRATVISFFVLIAFTITGQFLFSFFGISANGFRIAAGIIILKIGYDMLQARFTNTKLSDEEIRTYADDISITPLSIPLLCGPGAIANGIVLMEQANTLALKATLIVTIFCDICTHVYYFAGIHAPEQVSGPNRQQCHDASDGSYTYGDSCGMFCGRCPTHPY